MRFGILLAASVTLVACGLPRPPALGPRSAPARPGPDTERERDGSFERGDHVDGQRDGQWVSYRSDGSPAEKKTYAAGELEGLYVRYGPDGEPLEAGTYARGKRDGMWLRWTGDRREFTLYDRGEPGDVGGFSGGGPVRYKWWCMVARRAPFCRSVLFADGIITFGYPFERMGFPLDLDVGATINAGRNGFGLSASVGARFVRAHYRRYLTDRVYLSLSPGWRRGDDGGLTLKTTVNLGNLFGAGFELRRVEPTDDTGSHVYLFVTEVGVGACLARAFLFQPCSSRD